MRSSAGRLLAALSSACHQSSTHIGLAEQLGRVGSAAPCSAIVEALTYPALNFSAAACTPTCGSSASFNSGVSSYRRSHKLSRNVEDLDDVELDEFTPTSRNVKHMLLDPVSMLVAGRGVPLGFASRRSELLSKSEREQRTARNWLQSRINLPFDDDSSSIEQGQHWADPFPADDRILSTPSAHDDTDQPALWTSSAAASTETSSIADSSGTGGNGAASGGGAGGSGEDDDAEALKLFEQDADELKSIQQLRQDIKELDEVFEALAEVPWLDESVISQREQKGMLSVAMLGTLEEAGWKVRRGVHSIWAGERDIEVISQGSPPREQAALLSVLFHTRNIEEKFGPPSSPWKPATDFVHLYEGETVANQKEPIRKK